MAPTQGAPVVRLSTDGERRSMRPINARSETTGTARRPSPLIAADGSPLLVFAGRVHAGGGRQLAQLGLRPMRRRLVAIGRVGASGTAGKPPQAQSGRRRLWQTISGALGSVRRARWEPRAYRSGRGISGRTGDRPPARGDGQAHAGGRRQPSAPSTSDGVAVCRCCWPAPAPHAATVLRSRAPGRP